MKKQDFNLLIASHNNFFSGNMSTGKKLPEEFFYGKRFEDISIPSIKDLSGYPIQDSTFVNVIFNEINFNSAFLYGSLFDSCAFLKCSFIKAELGGIKTLNTLFNKCNFFRASFNNAEVRRCIFTEANLNKAIFSENILSDCKIEYHGLSVKSELKENNVIWLEC